MASNKKSGKAAEGAKTNAEILSEFQILRNEQRAMAIKLSEMEMEWNEHKIVIDTLKNVDPKRKCFKMTGGVLCELTVQDVMPALLTNKEQLMKVIDAMNDQLTKKGVIINEFKEKHNIRVRGQQDVQRPAREDKEDKGFTRSAIAVHPLFNNYA